MDTVVRYLVVGLECTTSGVDIDPKVRKLLVGSERSTSCREMAPVIWL